MRTILHIQTRREDSVAAEIIGLQKTEPALEIWVESLTDPNPDYDELVRKIFAADTVCVW